VQNAKLWSRCAGILFGEQRAADSSFVIGFVWVCFDQMSTVGFSLQFVVFIKVINI
jgi:hypothetical protein